MMMMIMSSARDGRRFSQSFQSSGRHRFAAFANDDKSARRCDFLAIFQCLIEKCPPAPCACERRDARRHERRTVRLAASRGSVMSHSAGACLSIRALTPPPSPATSDAKRRRPRSWFFVQAFGRRDRPRRVGRPRAETRGGRLRCHGRSFARIRQRRHAIDARLAPALTLLDPIPVVSRVRPTQRSALHARRSPLRPRENRAGPASAGITARA